MTKKILLEANLADKIKRDPRLLKMMELAWRHDATVPVPFRVQMGPRASAEDIVDFWGNHMDQLLQNPNSMWPDLSRDGKVDDWLLKIYTTGANDWEDLTGEAVDRLGKFVMLRNRNILKPNETDLNRYRNIEMLNQLLHKYNDAIQRLITAVAVENAKKTAESVTLIDNDRFLVSIPLNYGACYVFNHQMGHQSTFCTGSSTGLHWFKDYSKDGPLINVIDKKDMDHVMGKWQIHAPSRQINNSNQESNGDAKFAKLFPGLLSDILTQMEAHAAELNERSQNIRKGGWDIGKAVEQLRRTFPKSAGLAPAQKPKPST